MLNKIVLSYNFIENINDDHFKDQKQLRYLDLSYNLNIKIKFSFIKYSKEVETLILSGSLTNSTFTNISSISLTRLELTNSSIKNLIELNLGKLQKLKHLKLGHNNITKLQIGAFSNLSNLNEIDVSYNNINTIQPGVFQNIYRLKTLNISHNALFEISYGMLNGLVSLNELDISYNFINTLETEKVATLERLIVDHNNITNISVEDFRGLRILSIGDNPIACRIVENLLRPELTITAIRQVSSQEENFNGITCYKISKQNRFITFAKDFLYSFTGLNNNIVFTVSNYFKS